MNNPKVYLSYSHDSEDFKSWVLGFCNELRKKGIDAKLDQYQLLLTDNIPEFMEKGISESDFVIFFITNGFIHKYNERKGGLGYEINIATGEIFLKNNKYKFIPVLINLNFEEVPAFLLGAKGIRITNLLDYNDQFIELYAYLTGQTILKEPPLGEIVSIDTLIKNKLLFDIDEMKKVSGMPEYYFWQMKIINNTLRGKDLSEIFMTYRKYFLSKRKLNLTQYYPWVLMPYNQTTTSSQVIFSSKDYTPSITNQFFFEKMIFENNIIEYGFMELTNFDKLLINTRFSMLSILYILKFLKDFHVNESLPIDLTLSFKLKATKPSVYYFNNTLFKVNYNFMESYN